MKSKSLHIRVIDTEEIEIDLQFHANFAEHLPRLLPKAVCRQLSHRAIDPAVLGAQAAANEFQPGELFCFAEGTRTVRAWLE